MPNATEGDTSQSGVDDAEKPLTKADILALLKESLNPAITNHLKRFEKSFDEKLVKATTPKPKEADDGDGTQGDDEADKAKAKPSAQTANPAPAKADPEIDKLRKQLETITKKQQDADKRAADSERRRVEAEGIASLRSSLTGKVAAGAEDAVLAILRGRNAVAFGDDGAVRLKLRASADEPEDGLDLDGGIAAFLKTPEAKFFVPAPNGGAGGTKPRTGPLQSPTQQLQPGTRPGAAKAASPIAQFEQSTGESIDSLL